MSRTKKDGKNLNCVIDRDIFEKLEEYCNDVGQTKTTAIERILRQYFSDYYKVVDQPNDSLTNNNGGDAK